MWPNLRRRGIFRNRSIYDHQEIIMEKTSQTILFTALILLIVALTKAYAQSPDSSTIGVFTNLENGASGNGNAYGIQTVNDYTLNKNGKIKIQAVGEAEFGGQAKRYRNQSGSFARLNFTGRAWLHKRFALEAGGKLSGIYFADTALAGRGYVKYAWAPIYGAAFELGNGEIGALANYRWIGKRALYAAENNLTAIREASYIDGYSGGQRIAGTVEIPWAPKSKKVYSVGFAWGRHYYQRNVQAYGPVLGAVVHRYNVLEFNVGVGIRH
jgi:hypothetical protein